MCQRAKSLKLQSSSSLYRNSSSGGKKKKLLSIEPAYRILNLHSFDQNSKTNDNFSYVLENFKIDYLLKQIKMKLEKPSYHCATLAPSLGACAPGIDCLVISVENRTLTRKYSFC